MSVSQASVIVEAIRVDGESVVHSSAERLTVSKNFTGAWAAGRVVMEEDCGFSRGFSGENRCDGLLISAAFHCGFSRMMNAQRGFFNF